MKNLIILVVVMMTLGVNKVAAQKYIKNSETGDIQIIKNDTSLIKVNVVFDSNVPSFVREDNEVMTELLKKGKVQLSNKIKIKYDTFVCYYILKTQNEIVYLNTDSIKNEVRISYNPSFEKSTDKRRFSWWYLSFLLGIVSMVVSQNAKRESVHDVSFGLSVVFSILGLLTYIFMVWFSFLIAILVIIPIVVMFNQNNNYPYNKDDCDSISILYYVCIILAMVTAYF